MKVFFSKLGFELLVTLLAGIVTIWFAYYREQSLNQKRHIDCFEKTVYTDIDSNDLKENQLTLLYKGNSVPGIVTIDVELYNFSDKDCDNTKVLIEIIPDKNDSLELVETTVSGPDHVSAAVIKRREEHSKKGIILEYLIETANRADSLADVMFDANYQLIGFEEPTVIVSISGKGIEKRTYDRKNFQPAGWWESEWVTTGVIILCGIIVFVVMIRIINNYFAERNERWKVYLNKNLSKRIEQGKVDFSTESIVKNYGYVPEKFDYDDANKFHRWLMKIKPPSETET